MYSQKTFLPMAIGLSTHAVAQSVLTEVDSQDGNSTSSTKNRSVSSTGMIILCTIVALVLLIGVSFTAIFIIIRKRRSRARNALYCQDGFTETTQTHPVSRTVTEGENRSKNPKHKELQPDLENNARVGKNESQGDSNTRSKGWGSYFPFGRI
ncbi:hypothetical protein BO71DRAFT_358761 [Aspergillus ellipticus CBS 707.79]|uniref:Mid2 domain-containing protein n=1 Tax=Aspergillus ellipticus CBS 707.79 TaxID=1448320 RepID=A0A319DKF5_9EURO|nr:hypothetical protein BO71DRAFT_358761 [Aspergillus ellipticus CBS 707.79]